MNQLFIHIQVPLTHRIRKFACPFRRNRCTASFRWSPIWGRFTPNDVFLGRRSPHHSNPDHHRKPHVRPPTPIRLVAGAEAIC